MNPAAAARAPIGRVVTLGAFILDVLGRPVESIPPGPGSVVLQKIRAPRSTWRSSAQVGAIGDDMLAGIITVRG